MMTLKLSALLCCWRHRGRDARLRSVSFLVLPSSLSLLSCSPRYRSCLATAADDSLTVFRVEYRDFSRWQHTRCKCTFYNLFGIGNGRGRPAGGRPAFCVFHDAVTLDGPNCVPGAGRSRSALAVPLPCFRRTNHQGQFHRHTVIALSIMQSWGRRQNLPNKQMPNSVLMRST